MVSSGRETVIGVDSGGTFTDAVVLGADGRIRFDKAPTTPDDLSRGTTDAVSNVVGADGSVSETLNAASRFAHGTTVGTNALIERDGCRVGLITTKGFEDTTVVMRDGLGKSMGVPYRVAMDYLHNERPDPLPPKERIRGVTERIDADGNVLTPLDRSEARRAIEELLDLDVEAIAVNFLWSFRHPAHETTVVELARELAPDDVFVTRASSIAPVLGEYERSMTTIVNAYLGPIVETYLDRLSDRLADRGLSCTLQMMQCTGGLLPAREARSAGVSLINSGPVGGLVASQLVGDTLGQRDIIATDVGGTSFDVGVIRDGEFTLNRRPFLDKGIPTHIPAAEISTIGAGGGSIVWTNGNRLRVGPRSAGAIPGPVCYDRGGTEPTVTDALLHLGYLNPDSFFGGRMELAVDDATDALAEVGETLGLDTRETAVGTYEIVTSKMADLIHKVTVEEGYDPREFVLYSYGGAGPAFAAAYGEKLGVDEVVVPYAASVFSAFGIAFADVHRTYAQSNNVLLEEVTGDAFGEVFEQLETRARRDIDETDDDAAAYAFSYSVDVRYTGQMNELTVETGRSPSIAALRQQFNETYDQRYGEGASLESADVEATTFRLATIKTETDPPLTSHELGATNAETARRTTRTMVFPETGRTEGFVYDGTHLEPGMRVEGPAVVEKPRTAIVVPPKTTATVDEYENVRIRWDQ